MEQLWYYEDHGQAKGPVSTRDLIRKIKKGEMTLMDLIFKEGAPQWMPIESFSEITDLLGNVTSHQSADWIVLRSVTVDGKNINEQIGPYNAQQILDLIDKGKIRFSDYVWRTGYEKWVPLGRVDEFEKPLKSSVAVDVSLYSTPRHLDAEIKKNSDNVIEKAPLKKINFGTTKQLQQEEPKPEDARGEDLVAPKWKIPPLKPLSKSEKKEVMSREVVDLASPETETSPKILKKNQNIVEPSLERRSNKNSDRRAEKLDLDPLNKSSLPPLPTNDNGQTTFFNPAAPVKRAPPQQRSLADGDKKNRDKKQELPPLPSSKPAAPIGLIPPTVEKNNRQQPLEQKTSTEKNVEKLSEKTTEKTTDAPSLESATAGSESVVPTAAVDKGQVAQRRWMQIGIAACFLIIIFTSGVLILIGKKRIATKVDPFSIKIEPPAPLAVTQRPSVQVPSSPPPVAESEPAPTQSRPADKKEAPLITKTKNQKPSPPILLRDKEYDTRATVSGSFKDRSYYHHKERIYLFYTSNEGEQLVADIQKASKKHARSPKSWQAFYVSWKSKTKSYISKINKEAQRARLHRNLYKQLAASSLGLEDVGRDYDAHVSAGRSIAKVASAKSLEAQFKSIRANARSLDR